jgi:hypothetical protein
MCQQQRGWRPFVARARQQRWGLLVQPNERPERLAPRGRGGTLHERGLRGWGGRTGALGCGNCSCSRDRARPLTRARARARTPSQ